MVLPKKPAIPKITTRPPFTRTSVHMMTNPVSTVPVSRGKAALHVSVVTARNVMAAVVRRVAGSVMTSVRHVAHVRTSLSV